MSGPDIIAEYNSNWSTLQQHYTHGPRMDEPLMRMQGSNFSAVDYYHADALGSVVMMTAPVNTQVNPPSIPVNNINFYTAWGLRSSLAPAAIQPYTFTGREADAVGQIYMRNRYYAPRFGRFTQPDPKGFVNGVNTYAYVMNAPVNYVDPWGTVASSFSNTLSAAGSYIGNSFTSYLNEQAVSWAGQTGIDRYANTPQYYTEGEKALIGYLGAGGGAFPGSMLFGSSGYSMGSNLSNASQGLSRWADGAEVVAVTARHQANQGIDHLMTFMTNAERNAYITNSSGGSRYLGQAVHRATAQSLNTNYLARFNYNPTREFDFIDLSTGQAIELTTYKQLGSHSNRGANLVPYRLPQQ